MSLSFSYYLVINTIKLKGIKKIFSKNPIDYQALRKDDVYTPTTRHLQKNHHQTTVLKSKIHHFTQVESDQLVIYIHGGAFIFGPCRHHWEAIKSIYKHTNQNVWLIDYPKAPEHEIKEITENIKAVYTEALKSFEPKNISLVGDSAGGTLIIKLMQQISDLIYPKQLILICPVIDASFENEGIKEIETKDIMLAIKGVRSAKEMCLRDTNLKNPAISPLYDSIQKFPKTTICIATQDITSVDQYKFVEKLEETGTEINVIEGEKMPHIRPLLPIMKESKFALNQIVELLQ